MNLVRLMMKVLSMACRPACNDVKPVRLEKMASARPEQEDIEDSPRGKCIYQAAQVSFP
jgi:hypothetical protein